jgi:ComF family protein
MVYFKEILNTFLDIVYPRFCYMCDEKISDNDRYFCCSCYAQLKHYNTGQSKNAVKIYKNIIDESFSLFYFEPNTVSQKIIHMIKYDGMRNLGIQMGRRLGKMLFEEGISADLIIPVPLHLSRKRERGYNQAEVIAEGLSGELKIPVERKIIKRSKFTKSQTKLNREERLLNVGEAFQIDKNTDLSGKSVFVLDDVITTGATIASCARLIKNNKAKKVIALSLAYVDENHEILQITT